MLKFFAQKIDKYVEKKIFSTLILTLCLKQPVFEGRVL